MTDEEKKSTIEAFAVTESPNYSIPRFEDEHPEAAELLRSSALWLHGKIVILESGRLIYAPRINLGHSLWDGNNYGPWRFVGDPSVGRNDPCWCGSGLKAKKCHQRA